MIAKKNSRYDLERKRTALFAMGLLAAGSFTLAAFTYDSPLSIEMDKQDQAHQDIEYLVDDLSKKDEPVEVEQDPIDQPDDSQQSSPTIEAQASVSENIKKSDNTDKKFDAQVGLDDLGYNFGDEMPFVEEVDGEIFEWVDIDAEFVGGVVAMKNYINVEVKYPEDAIEMGDQGSVYISFVVELDGKVTNVFVEKGVCKSLDREAKRVVRSFPKWVPAELNAKKVRTRVRLPVVFVLKGE